MQSEPNSVATAPPTEWRYPGDDTAVICIRETEAGPMISESQCSVYDVMQAFDEGQPAYAISKTYNLTPYQVEVAWAYIRQFRPRLEAKLQELQQQQAPCGSKKPYVPRQPHANGETTTPPRKWRMPGDNVSVIRILETDSGPMISQSRSSVYDVMEAYDDGCAPWEIGPIYNLSPHQVEVALAYIAEHRETLEPELKEILVKKAERERYYRTLEAEIRKLRPPKMTPQRVALQALIDSKRQERGEL